MTVHSDITPDAARALLATADTSGERGRSAGDRSRIGAVLSIALGALVSVFFLASVYVLPVATWQVALVVSAGYVVGIVAIVTIYNVFRRVSPTGWIDRYNRGLAVSLGIFFVGLALSLLITERSPVLWVPLALASGLPVAINGSRRASR
ncbi:hypothetical protein [Glaciihabitans sp. dw_435]|uniref:hypothetical protein n=1 Tax=Glaciihabitans sp. dw_435 TaxID=2720081 RepID=UPI001BD48421|nr:hypothetical protein [Glaciihabitans sp. dw_435]